MLHASNLARINVLTMHPKANSKHTHTVILQHGRGSNHATFANHICGAKDSCGRSLPDIFPGVMWIFPEAPRITTELDEKAGELGTDAFMEHARDLCEVFLEAGKRVGKDATVLGGFGQGGAVALQALMLGGHKACAYVGVDTGLPTRRCRGDGRIIEDKRGADKDGELELADGATPAPSPCPRLPATAAAAIASKSAAATSASAADGAEADDDYDFCLDESDTESISALSSVSQTGDEVIVSSRSRSRSPVGYYSRLDYLLSIHRPSSPKIELPATHPFADCRAPIPYHMVNITGSAKNCQGVCMTPALLQLDTGEGVAVPCTEGEKLQSWLRACGMDVTMGYYEGSWGKKGQAGAAIIDQLVRFLGKAFKQDGDVFMGVTHIKRCGIHWCNDASVVVEHEVSATTAGKVVVETKERVRSAVKGHYDKSLVTFAL